MQSVDVEKKAETHRRMFFRSAYTIMISVLNMKVHNMEFKPMIADCHVMRYATFQHQVFK
jgi:hypothetical protein